MLAVEPNHLTYGHLCGIRELFGTIRGASETEAHEPPTVIYSAFDPVEVHGSWERSAIDIFSVAGEGNRLNVGPMLMGRERQYPGNSLF